MTEYLLYLYAESPVHTGASDSVDVLDLPIQREAATGYPVIWGQSLKGALRQAATDAGAGQGWDEERIKTVFGSSIEHPDEEGGTTPGTLAVGDAQLVAMPVPALRHTFAWATSEIALGRLARKYKLLHRACPELPDVASDRGLAASQPWAEAEREVIGPCLVPLGPAHSEPLARWADRIAADALDWDDVFRPFAGKLRDDLLLAGSGIISVLLSECTEQAVRVQLGRSKTVKNGPFYSEYLPTETIMAASLTLRGNGDDAPNRQALAGLLDQQPLQIGGDETLGKGLMWARLLDGRSS
ncbi:MAG TPA: type III-B CRISPR module RAMP protein Cmr4 [Streptosporangiaceae bacterium]|nr:type III-B CRISPR module RAMP protein Cmr4 [Streptosporangiaceae bacterium]